MRLTGAGHTSCLTGHLKPKCPTRPATLGPGLDITRAARRDTHGGDPGPRPADQVIDHGDSYGQGHPGCPS